MFGHQLQHGSTLNHDCAVVGVHDRGRNAHRSASRLRQARPRANDHTWGAQKRSDLGRTHMMSGHCCYESVHTQVRHVQPLQPRMKRAMAMVLQLMRSIAAVIVDQLLLWLCVAARQTRLVAWSLPCYPAQRCLLICVRLPTGAGIDLRDRHATSASCPAPMPWVSLAC